MCLPPTWTYSVCICPAYFHILLWTSNENGNVVGGADRPPSKQMIEQMRLEEEEMRKAAREERKHNMQAPRNNQGSAYWSDWSGLQHEMQERTERLGITGDSMERLEENSSNFVEDVNKFISTQKRRAALGCK